MKANLLFAAAVAAIATPGLAQPTTATAGSSAPQQVATPVSTPAGAPAPVTAPAEASAVPAANATAVPAVQEAPHVIAAPSLPQCELHVWPAERFQATTTSWGGAAIGGIFGALVDAAAHANGDKSRKSQMASALDSDGQAAALKQADLVGLLKLAPSQIILHPEPLNRKTINTIATRRAASASPCYSELIVADVLYQRAALYGTSLKTLFMFREFGAAQSKPRIYKSWGGNPLKIFPPKPGTDVEAANQELVGVFKKNFDEFTQNYRRYAKK
jgi:hypothetical protein